MSAVNLFYLNLVMNTYLSHQHEDSEDLMLLEAIETSKTSYLIIYNDDYNTFDWVIQCLMEICNHTFEQSEQLSLLIHYKGKAIVKTASFSELQPMKDAFLERGLSAVIETEVNS